MAPSRKPWHDSPYDEHGMPLGCETIDYDNEDERRKAMVKDKYEEPIPLNDPEYQPRMLTKKETGMDRNHGLPHGQRGFNSAIHEGVGLPDADVEQVDIEDPGVRRELLVREADDKGFSEVAELPKVADTEEVDKVGAKDEDNPEQEAHAENLEKNEEEQRVEQEEDREPDIGFLSVLAKNDEDKKDE